MANVASDGAVTTWREGAPASPYRDGQLLVVTRGEFRGRVLRVDGRSCFYEAQAQFYEGDPSKGLVSPAGWQIVMDMEINGAWLYFIRLHEGEVARWTVTQEG